MEKEEIKNRLANIKDYLDSGDIASKAIALQSFNHLIQNEILSEEQKQFVISFLKKEIEDNHSSLRTDCFETVKAIGIQDFNDIKDIFPILIKEFPKKNRFRSEIVLELLNSIIMIKTPEIEQAFRELIVDGWDYFNEPHLYPIYEKFIKNCLDNDFVAINKYKPEIKQAIKKYPSRMENIKSLFEEKLQEYNGYLSFLEDKQTKEESLRKERKFEQEKERLQKIESLKKLKEKLTKVTETDDDSSLLLDTEIEDSQSPLTYSNSDTDNDVDLETDFTSDEEFVNFTRLGLKRKQRKKN